MELGLSFILFLVLVPCTMLVYNNFEVLSSVFLILLHVVPKLFSLASQFCSFSRS